MKNIKDILKPKSKKEILDSLIGRREAIFKPTNKYPGESWLIGEVSASYKDLVKLFGEPSNKSSDDYKVTISWVLEDDLGNLVTLYEWKMTKNYHSSGYTLKQFKNLPSYEWHIAGNNINHAEDLKTFIYKKLL